jgi:hypothetical protein
VPKDIEKEEVQDGRRSSGRCLNVFYIIQKILAGLEQKNCGANFKRCSFIPSKRLKIPF